MKEILYDVETDGLQYTKIHCIVANGILFTNVSDFEDWYYKNFDSTEVWVAHNNCGFDFHVINDLTSITITEDRAADTSVLSKLKDYNKFSTHSLKELGEYYGVYKGDYTGGWEEYTPEMGKYCLQDYEVLKRIWSDLKAMWYDPAWKEAVQVEHQMALICRDMQDNGFQFNRPKAEALLTEVSNEMARLEEDMQKAWPPRLVEDRRIQWRVKKDGTPYGTCLNAMDTAPKWKREGDELILYKYKEFNPGSPKDRIDVLWEAGWKPYDKTKGHIQYERRSRER